MATAKRQQHIEIKSGSMYVPTARKIAKKGTVASVVVGGSISEKAKKILDRAGITWAENVEVERERTEKEGRR